MQNPINAMIYPPRTMFIYLGQRPAKSIPVETEFKTTDIYSLGYSIALRIETRYPQKLKKKLTASWVETVPTEAKNTPARTRGLES